MSEPTITTRFANPRILGRIYTLDVEFKSSLPGHKIHMALLEFWYNTKDFAKGVKLKGLHSGYTTCNPTKSTGTTPAYLTIPHGTNWFNFSGDQVLMIAAFQLNDINKGVVLPLDAWTKLCEIDFTLAPTAALYPNFKPPIVFELEADVTKGGFFPGNEGHNIAVIDPSGLAGGSLEKVVQYNWAYNGSLKAPYGHPVTA